MRRLLNIEWLKIKHARSFWIMIGLFVLCYLLIGVMSKRGVDLMIMHGPDELKAFTEGGIPIFDFADIWQNIAYLSAAFKWVLGFVVIISVTNEFGERTIRQNIIDGLSIKEFLITKVSLIGVLSLGNTILLFLIGLILGLAYSPYQGIEAVFSRFIFVPVFFLEVFSFLSLALLFSVVIRLTGFTLVLFIFYTLCIENLMSLYIYYQLKFPVWYFPFRSAHDMIHLPITKYFFQYTIDTISPLEVLVAILWTGIFILGSYKILSKKDI